MPDSPVAFQRTEENNTIKISAADLPLQVLGLPMAEEGAAESAWAEQGAAAAEGDPAPQRGPAAKGGRGKGGRGQRPPLYTFFHSVKKQHPKAVALVRVS
jgi:hypothetical protein